MPRLRNDQRSRAVGMLESGLTQKRVAGLFGVARITINRLRQRYRANASVADRPRTGRPRVTTQREDRRLRRVQLQNRFMPATQTLRAIPTRRRISVSTVRRRLRSVGLRARRPLYQILKLVCLCAGPRIELMTMTFWNPISE